MAKMERKNHQGLFDLRPTDFAYLPMLQLQYPAVVLSFFSEHLCLALKLFALAGSEFLIESPDDLESPNLTVLILSVPGTFT